MDSLSELTENAGWICSSETTEDGGIKKLYFSNICFLNIKNSFRVYASVKNGILVHFQLLEEPMPNLFDKSPVHTESDYKQLVALMESVYGTPSSSDTMTIPLTHVMDHFDTLYPGAKKDYIDTLFHTIWHNMREGKIYTVLFSNPSGNIAFGSNWYPNPPTSVERY